MLKFKKKNLFLLVGSVALLAPISIVAAACGDNQSSNSSSTNDKPAPKRDTKNYITNIQKNTAIKLADSMKSTQSVLITDHGTIDDKSFNQSANEALETTYDQLGFTKKPAVLVPQAISKTGFDGQYNAAIQKGYKIWILNGFLHGDNIKKFYKENVNKLKDVVFVTIDFNPTVGDDAIPREKVVPITFNVKQAAFIIGYAIGDFLSKKYPEAPEERVFSTFGGGAFPGVTDFNRGYLAGALVWNQQNPDKKVKINGTSVTLNSGFTPNSTEMTGAVTAATSGKVKIATPVAGPGTGTTLGKLKDGQFVVGVDTDQSLAYSDGNKNKFFTSTLKLIGQGVYNALIELYSGKTAANIDLVNGGFEKKMVGVAATSLTGNDKALATAALDAGSKVFNSSDAAIKKLVDDALKTDADFNANIQANLDALAVEINK